MSSLKKEAVFLKIDIEIGNPQNLPSPGGRG
jgi:hypothetical protein